MKNTDNLWGYIIATILATFGLSKILIHTGYESMISVIYFISGIIVGTLLQKVNK